MNGIIIVHINMHINDTVHSMRCTMLWSGRYTVPHGPTFAI